MGDEIQVEIAGVDQRRGRVDLSLKNLLPAPEESPAGDAASSRAGSEFSFEDDEEDFVSPFELAFQKANKSERGRRRNKHRKKSQTWDDEEYEESDIIKRTFAHHRKNKGK